MILHCEQCGEEIPREKTWKYTGKRRPRFCNRDCLNAWRRGHGIFKELSVAGNAAQRLYKEKHGVVPGYEQRKAALQRPGHNGRSK